jgi:hypothetical protein
MSGVDSALLPILVLFVVLATEFWAYEDARVYSQR